MLPVVLFALALLFNHHAMAAEPYPGKFAGAARIVDGDSLWIGKEEVRLLCIDAVELHQSCKNAKAETYPCGEHAKKAMNALIHGQNVSCFGHERDKYNRPLVWCQTADADLNKGIVAEGWAIATCAKLRSLANEAKAAKRGIWQGSFQQPRKWRKENPRPATP